MNNYLDNSQAMSAIDYLAYNAMMYYRNQTEKYISTIEGFLAALENQGFNNCNVTLAEEGEKSFVECIKIDNEIVTDFTPYTVSVDEFGTVTVWGLFEHEDVIEFFLNHGYEKAFFPNLIDDCYFQLDKNCVLVVPYSVIHHLQEDTKVIWMNDLQEESEC